MEKWEWRFGLGLGGDFRVVFLRSVSRFITQSEPSKKLAPEQFFVPLLHHKINILPFPIKICYTIAIVNKGFSPR